MAVTKGNTACLSSIDGVSVLGKNAMCEEVDMSSLQMRGARKRWNLLVRYKVLMLIKRNSRTEPVLGKQQPNAMDNTCDCICSGYLPKGTQYRFQEFASI